MLDFAKGCIYNKREFGCLLDAYDAVHSSFCELNGKLFNAVEFKKTIAKYVSIEVEYQKTIVENTHKEKVDFVSCNECKDVYPSTAYRLRHREGRYWLSNICRWCERKKNIQYAKISKQKKPHSDYIKKYRTELTDSYIKELIRRKYPDIKKITSSMIIERRQQIINYRNNKK